jgi:hypothetical protein
MQNAMTQSTSLRKLSMRPAGVGRSAQVRPFQLAANCSSAARSFGRQDPTPTHPSKEKHETPLNWALMALGLLEAEARRGSVPAAPTTAATMTIVAARTAAVFAEPGVLSGGFMGGAAG